MYKAHIKIESEETNNPLTAVRKVIQKLNNIDQFTVVLTDEDGNLIDEYPAELSEYALFLTIDAQGYFYDPHTPHITDIHRNILDEEEVDVTQLEALSYADKDAGIADAKTLRGAHIMYMVEEKTVTLLGDYREKMVLYLFLFIYGSVVNDTVIFETREQAEAYFELNCPDCGGYEIYREWWKLTIGADENEKNRFDYLEKKFPGLKKLNSEDDEFHILELPLCRVFENPHNIRGL